MALIVALFEHACGYALFRVKEFEEVAMLQSQVEASVLNLNSFKSIVQLIAFTPFKNAANALDNINSVSEGILHDDLQLFLETNLPKSTKSQKVTLGISDPKIGAAVQEALGASCQHTGVIPEIIRGLRLHFGNMVKGLTPNSTAKAQLGLGHSYSRGKVKFNVNRTDNMIIQSISLLDQLDKDINTFSMRIREWYSYHFPELVKIVPDNHTFAKLTKFIQDRKSLSEDKLPELAEIIGDEAKAQAVLDASKSSMGMDISPIDLINIENFATRVVALAEFRIQLMEYLKSRMHNIAPNLAALIGETVGARLISHAGSLTNLAKYPASTVQILGAEKALFRALKTKGNTPKYGLIFHSTFIGRAAAKNKGRISRYLANKCSIASRIDCFTEFPSEIFGQKLKTQVEDRLKFYETGEKPPKNLDVMKDALDEVNALQMKALRKQKKKEKKRKRQELEEESTLETTQELNSTNGAAQEEVEDEPVAKKSKKKKKKKSKQEDED